MRGAGHDGPDELGGRLREFTDLLALLDKAFHSAVVAVPLMYMQQQRGETTLVDAFADSLRDCCTGLNNKRDLFTAYGQVLLDELADFARTLDYDRVGDGFTRTDLAASSRSR